MSRHAWRQLRHTAKRLVYLGLQDGIAAVGVGVSEYVRQDIVGGI